MSKIKDIIKNINYKDNVLLVVLLFILISILKCQKNLHFLAIFLCFTLGHWDIFNKKSMLPPSIFSSILRASLKP